MRRCPCGVSCRLADSSMVAIGQEENKMPITADGEDPINGKGPAAEWVSRIDDRDLAIYSINERGSLSYLVQ